MKAEPSHPYTVLIVDDIPSNISALFDFLTEKGFKVLVAQGGKWAIKTVNSVCPDLILLDVMMPEMNGFEVCQILKSKPHARDIPIIFMTALTDTVDKIKGFNLGAADYITKPFQQEEVLARVLTQITLHQQQKQLQEQNRLLIERTAELEERNTELDAFAHMVAHDLKNPLNAVVNITGLFLEMYLKNPAIEPKWIERLQFVEKSGQQAVDIINALLTLAGVSRQNQIKMGPLNMAHILQQVIKNRLAYMLEEYQGKISLPDHWPVAVGYGPWVEEIWANYLSNALKYGGRPPQLELGATVQGDNKIRFWVRDNGHGLTLEAQEKLFTPFTRLHGDGEGHGLGLSIVQQIVEKLHGQVGAECIIDQGCVFYFTLPANSTV